MMVMRTNKFFCQHYFNTELHKLKNKLITCSVCFGTYTNPKQLCCNHVYCAQCLVGLVQQDQQDQSKLICPTCCLVTPVPPSGVAGLPSDFRTNQLLEFFGQRSEADHLEATASANLDTDAATSKLVRPKVIESIKFPCPDHHEELKIFCSTCEKTVCWKCVIASGKHFSHDNVEIPEALSKLEDKITFFLKEIEEQLGHLDSRRDEILREAEMLGFAERNLQIQLPLKELETERDLVDTTQMQLKKHLDSLREAKVEGGVLLLNSNIFSKVNDALQLLPESKLSRLYLQSPEPFDQKSGIQPVSLCSPGCKGFSITCGIAHKAFIAY